jgi:hypothetical protein
MHHDDDAGRTSRSALAAFAALTALGALQAFFALDVAWRVWATRSGLESVADALLIVPFEALRAVAIAMALGGAVLIARRGAAYGVPLATAVAALAVWYAAAFGFPGFAGRVQAQLAVTLRGAGVPGPVLYGIFGDATWPLWVAVAAALRAGARLLGGSRSGAAAVRGDTTPRAGLLRGSAVAGADVGAAFLRLAAATIERGWLSAGRVAAAAAAGIVLHIAVPALRAPLLLVLGIGGGLAFTLFRTAYRRSVAAERRLLRRLSAAATFALAGFLIGAAIALLAPGQAALSFVVLATTPLAVAGSLLAAGRA